MANPYPAASLAAELWEAAAAATPIAPRPAAIAPTPRVHAVRATGRGDSHPQARSRRRAVLDFIREQPGRKCTLEALEGAFGGRVARGDVQKLIEKGHLEPCA